MPLPVEKTVRLEVGSIYAAERSKTDRMLCSCIGDPYMYWVRQEQAGVRPDECEAMEG